jgi:hypothetical protein
MLNEHIKTLIMKKIILTLLTTLVLVGLNAQDFEIPTNYVFSKPEDYSKYEKEIIKACDWVTTTPINEQTDKRKEVNTFLMQWLTGCPYVSLEIKTEIMNFMKPNPELLMIFMAGWTKYSLVSKEFNNKVNGNLSGVEAVIEFYRKNKDYLKKDKNVEKYIDMKEKGTLEDYIKANA